MYESDQPSVLTIFRCSMTFWRSPWSTAPVTKGPITGSGCWNSRTSCWTPDPPRLQMRMATARSGHCSNFKFYFLFFYKNHRWSMPISKSRVYLLSMPTVEIHRLDQVVLNWTTTAVVFRNAYQSCQRRRLFIEHPQLISTSLESLYVEMKRVIDHTWRPSVGGPWTGT